MTSIAERYLLLGLRLGRLVDGLVDVYYGPDELRASVDDDPAPPSPETLRVEARALLADIAKGELEARRARWLTAQVGALECVAEMAAGEAVRWSEAVRRCYGIEVAVAPESTFEEAHRRLDETLPGRGDLADRLQRWNESQLVPEGRMLEAFVAVADALRERTRALVELPHGERVECTIVDGQPWLAYNWYLGGLASRIELNADLPFYSHFFVPMVAHEGYPGHHTERSCKEERLVRQLDWPEASLSLLHTPECLVAEGIAEVAVEQAWGERWCEAAGELLRPLGIPFDAPVAAVVDGTDQARRAVEVNIAYFVNEAGWSIDRAVAYHRRWALSGTERAEQAVRFCTHPLWSAYVPTYAYGYELVRVYAARATGNFRRLLTEPMTTADLL